MHSHFGLCGITKVELIQLFASQADQARVEGLTARRLHQGLNGPVFLVAKRFDFHLALYNDAQANRLNAASRFRTGQFAPQNWGKIETDQIIQRAAGQISLDQRLIDLTGIGHRVHNGSFCDRVEHHAANGRVFLDRLLC